MPAVIRLEEHALDWLYAISAGVDPRFVVETWAEKDKRGKRVPARRAGWWWNQLGHGTGNQRELILALAKFDQAFRGGGTPQQWRRLDQLIEAGLRRELAAGIAGPEFGNTYLLYYLLARTVLAHCCPSREPIGGLTRVWLAATLGVLLELRDDRGVCRVEGGRSKRDSHPQVDAWVAAAESGVAPAVAIDFRPGSIATNRGLYLAHAMRQAISSGALGAIRPDLRAAVLACPIMTETWESGRRVAYVRDPLRSYDGAQPAAAWGGGQPAEVLRHPLHDFVPDSPIVVDRQAGRVVAHFRGLERRGSTARADIDLELAVPAGFGKRLVLG